MKLSLSIVLLLCLPLTAPAQMDPRPDVMGMSFSPNFVADEGYAPTNVPFTVYALLQNPTQSLLSGFEFGYDHRVWGAGMESLVMRLATNYPPGILIIDPPLDPLQGSYTIGLPAPVPTAQPMVLMSWDYMLLGNIVVEFDMTAAENGTIPGDYPGYWTPDLVVPCNVIQTCWGTGAAMNASCPLPVENHTWGTLKGLYR